MGPHAHGRRPPSAETVQWTPSPVKRHAVVPISSPPLSGADDGPRSRPSGRGRREADVSGSTEPDRLVYYGVQARMDRPARGHSSIRTVGQLGHP